jgi:penicillin amidase
MQAISTSVGTTFTTRAFIRLLEEDPTKLATYDAATGQSALWDDLSTTATVESRTNDRERQLDGPRRLGEDSRRRSQHVALGAYTVRFDSLVSLWLLTIPPVGDAKFPRAFAAWRPVERGCPNYGIVRSRASELNFSYGSGPVQRFVAEMTAEGPKVQNALPGGAVMDPDSLHLLTRPSTGARTRATVPFEIDAVTAAIAEGGEHILFSP